MCRNFAEKGEGAFGIKPRWLMTQRTGPHRANHGDTFYRVAFYSNTMANHIVQETVDKKKIPEWVKTGVDDIKAAFIRGFADAEGCATIHGKRPYVSIAQKAREWLDDIRGMLSAMGISSRIYFSKGANGHSLSIYRIADVKRFATTVGFSISRKQNRLVVS
jgi:intein/homing endonuclease